MYGSESDSAVFYFNKAWEHILDYGQWTESEAAFRKAVEFDSSFLVGKSLLGKNTTNLEERIKLLDEVNSKKHLASEDELLIIDMTLLTLQLFNDRDQGKTISPEFIQHFYNVGERDLRKFSSKYPSESYIKAEYIEFLHAQHGAQLALDSIGILASNKQKKLPFFISYSAILHAELGDYDIALEKASQLEKQTNDSSIPEPHALFAKIYFMMDSIELADNYISKAIELDSNHIIAKRLKRQIDEKMKEVNDPID